MLKRDWRVAASFVLGTVLGGIVTATVVVARCAPAPPKQQEVASNTIKGDATRAKPSCSSEQALSERTTHPFAVLRDHVCSEKCFTIPDIRYFEDPKVPAKEDGTGVYYEGVNANADGDWRVALYEKGHLVDMIEYYKSGLLKSVWTTVQTPNGTCLSKGIIFSECGLWKETRSCVISADGSHLVSRYGRIHGFGSLKDGRQELSFCKVYNEYGKEVDAHGRPIPGNIMMEGSPAKKHYYWDRANDQVKEVPEAKTEY